MKKDENISVTMSDEAALKVEVFFLKKQLLQLQMKNLEIDFELREVPKIYKDHSISLEDFDKMDYVNKKFMK